MSWSSFLQNGRMPGWTATLQRLPALVLALFFFSPAGASMTLAGEGPATEPSPTTQSAPAPAAQPDEPAPTDIPPEENKSAIEQSVDEVHETLERGILEQAIWLDDFFGYDKADSKQRTGYELRWRNSVRVEQGAGAGLKFGSSLRANIVLSKISERLRLSLTGENEPEPFTASLPEDPGNPGFDRPSQTTRIVNTELRYGLLRTPTADIFVGAGIRLIIPPQAFVRSRLQYTYNISDVSLVRIGETVFLNNSIGAGETTEVNLERALDRKTLLRWANTGTVSRDIRGLEWGTDLSLIHELSPRSAITVAAGVFGNTSLAEEISSVRALARYRRNFLRKWLFYELEPEVAWPRSADGEFRTRFAITFLLEVVFQGSATGKPKKDGAP